MKKIVIAHLYPREMNIYGDLGNIITLQKRLEWRGFAAEVRAVEIGKQFAWDDVDIVFGGGGQDSSQSVVGPDLLRYGKVLQQLAAGGTPMLVVCGLYQLFGHEFKTLEGTTIPGIGIFDCKTTGGKVRMIGNVVIDSPYGRLVGFENHSGQTVLAVGQESLGTVQKGFGNNPQSGREGAVRDSAIGTYMHGPILPKNPHLADHLIGQALRRRHGVTELSPLDDSLEIKAAEIAAARP